ncbi:MAG: NADH-quinone oxidoreductase subunit D [Chloroflexi bacterium]|nr:NADH-quinone oxidoreductase subunit D [Chloroflexota bacterium]
MAVTPPPAPPETKEKLNDPQLVAEKIKATIPDGVESVSAQGIVIKNDKLLDVVRYLHDGLGFDYLNNVTSVDYLDRFEVVYHLTSLQRGGAPLTLKANADHQDPTVPSLVPVYRGANFQEREVYDMMGIKFTGHPDLRRILMWEGFGDYPLRKSYKEPYWEDDHKPFGTRWDKGHHVIAEDRNPWHDNVKYPANFDAMSYKPTRELLPVLEAEQAATTKLRTDELMINIGPQHPSTHGVLRLRTVLNGETIVSVEPVLGYLHRQHEKIGERNTYLQNIPYTDRLDYFTSMSNNFHYVIGVEKLMNIKPPERAEYIRIIMAELTRWLSHIVALGFFYNDLGAFYTPLIYSLEEREMILDLFEAASGSRMMCNYMRFGGLARDVPEGFVDKVQYLVDTRLPKITDELESYLSKNELFLARTKNVGILTREMAISYSTAGPVLRASGVKYDVRRAEPYSIYDRFEFDIPTGTTGDVYDRFIVRLAEMRESVKILKQALKQLPPGEIMTGKKNYQIRVPKGEVYGRGENPKGELGFFVVSDGSPNPYRYHVRAPAFINLGALNEMAKGYKVADMIIIQGSIDVVMGEVDR